MTIAIVSNSGLGEYNEARDFTPYTTVKQLANDGDISLLKAPPPPDFVVELDATTDTSDGEAIDLTTEGVLFPANSMRTIRCRSTVTSANDVFVQTWEQDVKGHATTPVLLAQRFLGGYADQAGTLFEYGEDLHFSATITALTTIDTISASFGYSAAMADVVTGFADFLVPRNSFIQFTEMRLDGALVSATAAGNLVTATYTNLDGLGAGTDAIVFYESMTSTDALTDDPIVGTRIDLAFRIRPPFNHRLVMDSNNVTLKCAGTNANLADDTVRHKVEVWVGALNSYQLA
jgi:hypothetical protein